LVACPSCGYENSATSRFCRQCGTPLTNTAQPPSEPAPATAETTPLAEEAAPATDAQPVMDGGAEEAGQPAEDVVLQTQPVADDDGEPQVDPGLPEETTTPTQPLVMPPNTPPPILEPGARVGEYEIVDVHEERDGYHTYRATAPADVCAQCGTRAADEDARFCEECGAELVPRHVLLAELPMDDTEPATGPARLIELADGPQRALLPPATAFATADRRFLVMEADVPGYQSLAELLASGGESPGQPAALDEADALPIALQLAQLLQFLHENDTALGDLSLAQLLIGPQRRLRLRDAANIQPLSDANRASDVQQLGSTIEDLTRSPRLTRKLDEGTSEQTPETPDSLDDVLAAWRSGELADASQWVAALEQVVAAKSAIRTLATTLGARTDVGVQREIDEDALMTQELRIAIAGVPVNAGIYVVADGMGGHAAGEVASTLAVQAAATSIAQQLVMLASPGSQVDDARLSQLVQQAVEEANIAVFEEGQRRNNDMGTTLTLALVVGDRCMIGNVGDSRTYLVRDGKLTRVSKDHSLVMRLVDVGQITEDEIYSHPHRSAILRSLGERPQVQTDTFPLRLQPGDALFLCSDGQWEMVRDPRMNEIINTVADPQAACEQLVDEANANGGEDNITAVLVRFE
jgi:PPM family protein phosphatase